MRIWDSKRGDLLNKTQLNSQPFVCASSAPNIPLVAVGSVDGVLRILMISKKDDPNSTSQFVSIIYEEKLFDKAITQLSFHDTLPYLVVSSMAGGRCYVLDVSYFPSFLK